MELIPCNLVREKQCNSLFFIRLLSFQVSFLVFLLVLFISFRGKLFQVIRNTFRCRCLSICAGFSFFIYDPISVPGLAPILSSKTSFNLTISARIMATFSFFIHHMVLINLPLTSKYWKNEGSVCFFIRSKISLQFLKPWDITLL